MHIIFVRGWLRGCAVAEEVAGRGRGCGGEHEHGGGGGAGVAREVRVTARLLHTTSSRHFFIIIALRWNLFQQGSVIE